MRTVFAIASKRNMLVHSADFDTALFTADMQGKAHMRPPKGTEDGTPRVMW
jgi:hypothetical protein